MPLLIQGSALICYRYLDRFGCYDLEALGATGALTNMLQGEEKAMVKAALTMRKGSIEAVVTFAYR